MTDSELDAMLHHELESAEPPFHLDLEDLRRRGRHRTVVRRACTGLAVVAVVTAVGAVSVGLRPGGGDETRPTALDSDPASSSPASPSPSTSDGDDPGDAGVPGNDVVTALGDPLVSHGTGTTTVALGPRPDGATEVYADLTCLTPGTFAFPKDTADGATDMCSTPGVPAPPHAPRVTDTVVRLKPGQDDLVIETSPTASFEIVTTYVETRFVPDPVNANGQTYGVVTDGGHPFPDLVGVRATNGRSGYAYQREYAAMPNRSRIPVYESDGTTQIGTYRSSN